METESFWSLVEEALAEIPEYFRKRMENISVEVMPIAPPEIAQGVGKEPWSLLGVYQGVPYSRRNHWYSNVLPDRIIIFQLPIERLCRTRTGIRRLVRRVVIHEVGHYFGLSDEELRRLESEADAAARKKNQPGGEPADSC